MKSKDQRPLSSTRSRYKGILALFDQNWVLGDPWKTIWVPKYTVDWWPFLHSYFFKMSTPYTKNQQNDIKMLLDIEKYPNFQ